MLRYYMTPETRQAVIDESNRLIATRAAVNASRAQPGSDSGAEDSAFARLVADLQFVNAKTTYAEPRP